jgi:hypothetical protein
LMLIHFLRLNFLASWNMVSRTFVLPALFTAVAE